MAGPSKAELAYTPGPGYKPSPTLPPPVIPEDLHQPRTEVPLYPPPPRSQTLPVDTTLPQDPYAPPARQQTAPMTMSQSREPYSPPAGRRTAPVSGPQLPTPTAYGAPAAYQAAYQPPPGWVPSKVLPPPPIPESQVEEEQLTRQKSKKDDTENGTKDDIIEIGFEILSGLAKVR